MKQLMIRKCVFAGSYILLAVLIELITFLTMGLGPFPEYFGLDFAVIVIFAFLLFIIPHGAGQVVFFAIMLLFQIVLSIANEALYAMSGTVFSFGMLNLVSEVTGVMDASFLNWWLLSGLFLLFAAALAGAIVLVKKVRVPKGTHTRNALVILLVAFVTAEAFGYGLYAGTYAGITASAAETDTAGLSFFYDEEILYSDQRFPAKAFQKFGTFGYNVVNASNAIRGTADSDGVTAAEVKEYFRAGAMSADAYGDNLYTGTVRGKNIVLIVIESGEWYAINRDYTPTLYAMATQGIAMTDFHARDKTNVSEALGVMGSYPSANKLEPAAVTENEMPYTLPNILRQEGYATNYFHANDGSYYHRNKIFGELYGFEHTHFLDTMELLDGYTHKSGFYDLDKDSAVFQNYAQDMMRAEDGAPFFTQMMTLTSHGKYEDLLDHGNYPYTDVPERTGERAHTLMDEAAQEKFSKACQVKGLEEYYRLIDGFPTEYIPGTTPIHEETLTERGVYTDYFLRYKRYQAAIMDLDLGVNTLVRKLDAEGELDNTLFFFYADHSAYYDQMNFLMKGVDPEENYNTDVYQVPCFLWYGGSMDLTVSPLTGITGYEAIDFTATAEPDSPLTQGTVEKFTNTYDVLPTLLHLCGYSFNTRLYHGTSFFTEDETLFVSHESGLFTDDIYFNGMNIYCRENGAWVGYDFDTAAEEGTLSESALAFLQQAEEYYAFQTMRDAVIETDYFADHDFYATEDIRYFTKL